MCVECSEGEKFFGINKMAHARDNGRRLADCKGIRPKAFGTVSCDMAVCLYHGIFDIFSNLKTTRSGSKFCGVSMS